MKWGISLKQLVVLQMFVGVFIPWGQMETFTAGGLLLALVIAIVKLVVGVTVIALFENSMARLRLDITPRITDWVWLCIFSVRLLAGGVIKESLSMSEEKLGQHYLAALNEAFPASCWTTPGRPKIS